MYLQAFYVYCSISIVWMIGVYLKLLLDDVCAKYHWLGKQKDHKFGYNCTNTLTYFLLILYLPILNIFTFFLFLVLYFPDKE